jgi:pheromone shutdown protein TraB
MKNRETVRAIVKLLNREAPRFADALVNERDAFMVDQLLRHCKQTGSNSVVAVIGIAHMDGVEQLFMDAPAE